MLIHPESENCVSNITEDEIDNIARECYQSQEYTDDGLENGGWLCERDSQSFLRFTNTRGMSHPALTLSVDTVVWLSWNVLSLVAYSGFCE